MEKIGSSKLLLFIFPEPIPDSPAPGCLIPSGSVDFYHLRTMSGVSEIPYFVMSCFMLIVTVFSQFPQNLSFLSFNLDFRLCVAEPFCLLGPVPVHLSFNLRHSSHTSDSDTCHCVHLEAHVVSLTRSPSLPQSHGCFHLTPIDIGLAFLG